MEEVCERDNLKEALRRVQANKGSAGVDRMTVDDLTDHLRQHWPAIRSSAGTYEPKPVRRVEIPKLDGGMRKRHPDRAGPLHPASGAAGAATQMDRRSPAQLRVSTGTVGASGRGPGEQYIAKGYDWWWISIWRNSLIASTTTN